MNLPPEFWFAAGIAAVAFLAGLWWLRVKRPRTRSVGRMAGRGPTTLRYVCASCSGRFTHSRRTRLAWEKGARSFYCSACHTRTLGAQTSKPSQLVPQRKAKSGCLGAAMVIATVPAGLVAMAWHYLA
jgi:hypothetical protein